jgi:hypothetical protein
VAGKTDFTEQEWEQLEKGVTGSAMLVAVSDRGFFDTFKEASAMAKHLAAGREHSSSELVRDLGSAKGTGFGIRTSPEELEREAVATTTAAVALLEQKAPDEVDAYRQFVLEVAGSVAEAAKEVSTGESRALETVKAALGTS